ncbi:hypothetical protein D9M71_597830 [compost metagenome]
MQAAVDGQLLLPIHPSLQRQALLGVAGQQELLDVRPFAVDPATQLERHRAALARQAGLALHGETLLECPLDHMSVEAHVVVIAVQQEQRRAWLLGQPCLPDQVEPRCLKAAQPAVCRQVQAIEALVVLRLCRQWLASGERRQAGAQAVGVKGRGHRVHPQ